MAEDEHSGGGKTPYLELDVTRGDLLAVLVAIQGYRDSCDPELHLVASPREEAAIGAAREAREVLQRARRLQEEGDLSAARTLLKDAARPFRWGSRIRSDNP